MCPDPTSHGELEAGARNIHHELSSSSKDSELEEVSPLPGDDTI